MLSTVLMPSFIVSIQDYLCSSKTFSHTHTYVRMKKLSSPTQDVIFALNGDEKLQIV